MIPRHKGGVPTHIGISFGYICVGLRCRLADGGSADGMAITYGEECLIPPSRSVMLFSIRGVKIAFLYHLVFLVPVISGWKKSVNIACQGSLLEAWEGWV